MLVFAKFNVFVRHHGGWPGEKLKVCHCRLPENAFAGTKTANNDS